ncbi:MAG: cation:proton antiporter, partial [Vulcanimicrobiaceae bacterium]
GVLLTAFFVAIGLTAAGLLPFLPALLLGAILAATDPIVVIALFRRLAVPTDLTTIVEGESLFNDGVAIVLYGVAVSAIAAGSHQLAPGPLAGHAIVVAAGGAAIGFAGSLLVALVLRGVEDAPLQIVGTVVAAYGAYLVADRLHLSGIFAAVVVGIALRAFKHFPTTTAASVEIDRFWAVLAFFANSLVFILMGLRIEFERISHEPFLVLLTLGLLTLARVILAYGMLPFFGIRGERRGWQHVVALAGMRGALSLALALSLPQDLPFRPQLIDAVFGVVFITLVTQGIAIGPVLRRLQLATV